MFDEYNLSSSYYISKRLTLLASIFQIFSSSLWKYVDSDVSVFIIRLATHAYHIPLHREMCCVASAAVVVEQTLHPTRQLSTATGVTVESNGQPLNVCGFNIWYPKDHWTLKTGYFEDLTPAIQVQSLPLEGPWDP